MKEVDMLKFTFGRAALPLLAALVFAPGIAMAQARAFPWKQVTIVVPQATGGSSDALSRMLSDRLSAGLKQPVIVDNRPGAGGNIGMELVAKAPADGHTLLMGYVGTHAVNPFVYRNLSFDIQKDFVPVASVATLPIAVVVGGTSPLRSMKDLADKARGAPEKVTFGSAGNGSIQHFLGELFDRSAGVRTLHIPYKGAAAAMTDLIGGRIDLYYATLPSAIGHVRAGSLRALAVTSSARQEVIKDVPTIAEAGFPQLQLNAWFGLFAPAGTPPATLEKLRAEINAALKSKDVADRIRDQGAEVYISSAEEFDALLKSDFQRFGKLAGELGLKLD
jgi:tripartite-type tricarboxylate transporter receptor subunit TctC